MVCRHCGLDTGSGAGHRSEAECIQALTIEIERAKRVMRREPIDRQGPKGPESVPSHAGVEALGGVRS